MAGSKRPLDELDGNDANSQPASKRASKESAVGKENLAPSYGGLTKSRLCTLLQDRSLPASGNKQDLIRKLEEYDELIYSQDESGRQETPNHLATIESEFDFIAICRPLFDIEEEIEEMDQSGDEMSMGKHSDEAKKPESTCDSKSCICENSAADHPQWKWLLTKDGYQMAGDLERELHVRNQYAASEYYPEDWSGYAFQEVVENQLVNFDWETRKKTSSPAKLWSLIEGFAWLLLDQEFWLYIYDSDRAFATVKLIGRAVFYTLNVFEKRGLLRPDSPVKNIGLVLAILRYNLRFWPGHEDKPELEWCEAAIEEAQKRGIEFKGAPYGVEKSLKSAGINGLESRNSHSKWKRFQWSREVGLRRRRLPLHSADDQ
ncbi:uncharacterized protein Z518_00181 [Rhinocladiella mackenziei CBS 650.93]|uniref:SAP domain-containing protein n=1 Tax=Rhinocladiella mackenziei CBS 650.93 TaxID=1442369 RepID=A0A0D2HEP9_9EURO|nr:uncharacterized protein Z518_00181 [Rhinocladiella mackenziei CBS 650.93]KIX09103.1 hypothetical protein Z518_00181 [Rhinocladiella mackenziei CBS 650.93]